MALVAPRGKADGLDRGQTAAAETVTTELTPKSLIVGRPAKESEGGMPEGMPPSSCGAGP